MILQVANVVSGLILAAPGLKKYGAQAFLEKVEHETAPLRENIGVITLVLGIIGLIDRMNFISFYIPNFGSSYPQAIPAILSGALLALPKLERYPAVATQVKKLLPYTFGLGLISLASGLGSLLFGCIVPIACHVPF